jgi:hypothetical protein
VKCIVVSLVLSLSGAAHAQEAIGKGPLQRQAISKLVACLKYYGAQLDDGVSDAATIAVAVTSACYREKEQLDSADNPTRDPDFERGYRPKLDSTTSEFAVRAVLDHRRGVLR